MIPQLDTEPTALINAAEQALFQAKRKGCDRLVFG
ncbi:MULTISPECIES: hypothetical protein [unclassified Anabaena]